MATSPAGKKPAPRKTPAKKPAAPVKRAAGKAAPAPVKKKAPAKPASAIKKDSARSKPQLGLNQKQQRFVDEYLVDLNATQAAIRAGYSVDSARQMASENLSKPYIQAAIAEARKAQQERTGITADRVLREIALIAFADARELSQVHKGCCRHCWGEGHRRQRTIGEMNHAMMLWQKDGKSPADFDEEGGIGYNPHRPPHPECPDCMGNGHAHTVICDTRHLSPQAQALYAGVKTTKYGIEVLTHSKMAAVEMLNKHLGIYEKDNQQKTDPLASLLNTLANGNSNGFKPVHVDPEGPQAGTDGNSLQPRQEVDNGSE